MRYFKKINLDLSGVDIERIQGGSLQEGYSENFRSYDILDNEYFYNFYSQRVNFKIAPDYINYTELTTGAWPHVDQVACALNYYVDTAGEITIFWKLKNPDYKETVVKKLMPDGTWAESPVKS